MPWLCHMSKLSILVSVAAALDESVAKWQYNTQINGTLLLMNDKANCGNGLLLFGLDKYSDKWSALIIPSVFVPERRRHRFTRDACRMRQAN